MRIYKIKFVLTIFFSAFTFLLYAQSAEEIDSLKAILKTNVNDTVALKILSDLNWYYATNDANLSKEYGFRELKIAINNGSKKWIAQSYNDIGISNFKLGYLDSALYYYNKSLAIRNTLNDKALIASTLSKIGLIYQEQGDFNKALEHQIKTLKIFEETNNEVNQALTLNNICSIYDKLKNFKKAIEYGEKAIAIHLKNKNDYGAASCYSNLATIYKDNGMVDRSTDYLQKALAVFVKYGDKYYEAAVLSGIGLNLRQNGNNKESLLYYKRAYNIAISISDKLGIALYGHNLSCLNSDLGNYLLAEKYSLTALENTEAANKFQLSLTCRQLANIYAFLNNGKKSRYYLDRYVNLKDSIYNQESSSQMAEMESKYQNEKKQLEIDKLGKEKELQISENKKQRILIFSFLAGFIMILVFSVFLYRLFLQKKRANIIIARKNQSLELAYAEINTQKEEITAQRDEIEVQRDKLSDQNHVLSEQKKEITDSINYARRIQQAVLPDFKGFTFSKGETFLEHFILFKPKDVVSGDFYWATRINEWLIVTVADCTGHGVPGAFMSMLGVSFLNEIVRKKEITKASQVLDNLRESIIDALQQKGHTGEQKDGMDIALCALNLSPIPLQSERSEGVRCQFAGANNPLYLVKNVSPLQEVKHLNEIKGDKQPVAIYEKMKPFTNHELQLQKGDTLYLCSDGYEDQFGGPKYKKFMTKQLKELFINIAEKPMDEQKKILETTFENWKGEHEQTDDVTILGLKL